MNRRELIFEYLLISMIISIYLLFIRLTTPILAPPDPYFYKNNDHFRYIQMAKDPVKSLSYSIPPPFCYRILMPFIAWLLPFDIITSFHIITITSLFCTGIILYNILKKMYSKFLALTGVTLFFSLEYGPRYLMYNIYLSDSLAFFFLTVCFWGILNSNLKIYSLSLFFGILCKEIVLFTIPVMIISEFLKKDIRAHNPFLSPKGNCLDDCESTIKNGKDYYFKCKNRLYFKTITSILPSISTFVLLRIVIKPLPRVYRKNNESNNYFYLVKTIGYNRILNTINNPLLIYAYIIVTWGLIITFFVIFNEKKIWIYWTKLYFLFLIFIYAQLLIAVNTERLLVAGFLPMILLSLCGMQKISKITRINENIFLIIAVIYFCTYLIIFKIISILYHSIL